MATKQTFQGTDWKPTPKPKTKKTAKRKRKPRTMTTPDPNIEHLDRIRQVDARITKHESKLVGLVEQVKETKSLLKRAQSELREEIRDNNLRLPFPTEPTTDTAPAGKPVKWRERTLDDLKIAGRAAKMLTDAKLDTLGKIADHTKDGELTRVKGIGEAMATLIGDKLERFWEEQPPETRENAESEVVAELKDAKVAKTTKRKKRTTPKRGGLTPTESG